MFQTLESDEAAVQTSTVLTDFFSAVDQQPSPLPPSPPSSLRTLEYILLESGWRVDGDCKRLLVLLQASLESVLFDRTLYNSILADFEDRLNNDVIGTD